MRTPGGAGMKSVDVLPAHASDDAANRQQRNAVLSGEVFLHDATASVGSADLTDHIGRHFRRVDVLATSEIFGLASSPVGVSAQSSLGVTPCPVGVAASLRNTDMATAALAGCRPGFRLRVSLVVQSRADPEMRRVAARRVVTGVADVHAMRDGADLQFIRDPMCSQRASTNPELSIAASPESADPRPTVIRSATVNVAPESIAHSQSISCVYY